MGEILAKQKENERQNDREAKEQGKQIGDLRARAD